MPLAMVWLASASRFHSEEAYFAVSLTALCTVAALVFAARYPEKNTRAPGRYDMLLHSHQLMHVGLIAVFVLEWYFMRHMCQEDMRVAAGEDGCKAPHECWAVLAHAPVPAAST